MTDPLDPLRALARLPDALERGKQITEALRQLPDLQAELREARKDAANELRESGHSLGAIADQWGLARARVQQISEGRLTGKRKEAPTSEADSEA